MKGWNENWEGRTNKKETRRTDRRTDAPTWHSDPKSCIHTTKKTKFGCLIWCRKYAEKNSKVNNQNLIKYFKFANFRFPYLYGKRINRENQ